MIGLCGGHRTGKTSLAKAYAEKHGIAFVETSVSAIFRDLGYDPADTFDFKTRLDIQHEVLVRVDSIYGELNPMDTAITDRTPLDMLAYTMAEAIGKTVRAQDQKRFEEYTRRCFEVTNRRFGTVILVQPGIPLVKTRGKAALNVAYIEHLNSLILGLSVDERLKAAHFYLPRRVVDLDERVGAVGAAVGRATSVAKSQMDNHLLQGGCLQ